MRHLVLGELLPAVRLDLVLAQLAARVGLQDHDGLDPLPDRRVGNADHAGRLHLGMAVEHVLDILGEDRVALVLDQVLGAVVEVEVALAVHAHDVAGAQPPRAVLLDEGARGLLGPVPVAEHHVRAVEHQLARLLPGGEFERLGIDHRGPHVGHRAAEAPGLRPLQRIEVAQRRGFRQAVALDDGRPGAPRPGAQRRFVQGVGAREHQLQSPPVDLVGVLVVLEVLVERRHAVKHRRPVALHRRENRFGVGAGEQDQQVSLAQAVQHDHRLAVDVEERQEGENHLLARLEGPESRLSADQRGDQVVMRQHDALRIPGRAAGVGQRGDVGFRVERDVGGPRWMALQQILQPMRLGRSLHLPREQTFERRQVLADVRHYEQIDGDPRFRDLLVEDILADHGSGAAVLELVAHLVAGVDRADRRDRGAALQRREIGDDELRAVDEVQRDAVALFHAEPGERAGEAVGRLAQLPVGDRAAIEHHCGAPGGALGRLVEHPADGLEGHLDRGRHALLVVLEPGTGQIALACAHTSSDRRF